MEFEKNITINWILWLEYRYNDKVAWEEFVRSKNEQHIVKELFSYCSYQSFDVLEKVVKCDLA